MLCQYCGAPVPRHKIAAGAGFCSEDHRLKFAEKHGGGSEPATSGSSARPGEAATGGRAPTGPAAGQRAASKAGVAEDAPTLCRLCGQKLPFVRRLKGSRYCSAEHEAQGERQNLEKGLLRLHEAASWRSVPPMVRRKANLARATLLTEVRAARVQPVSPAVVPIFQVEAPQANGLAGSALGPLSNPIAPKTLELGTSFQSLLGTPEFVCSSTAASGAVRPWPVPDCAAWLEECPVRLPARPIAEDSRPVGLTLAGAVHQAPDTLPDRACFASGAPGLTISSGGATVTLPEWRLDSRAAIGLPKSAAISSPALRGTPPPGRQACSVIPAGMSWPDGVALSVPAPSRPATAPPVIRRSGTPGRKRLVGESNGRAAHSTGVFGDGPAPVWAAAGIPSGQAAHVLLPACVASAETPGILKPYWRESHAATIQSPIPAPLDSPPRGFGRLQPAGQPLVCFPVPPPAASEQRCSLRSGPALRTSKAVDTWGAGGIGGMNAGLAWLSEALLRGAAPVAFPGWLPAAGVRGGTFGWAGNELRSLGIVPAIVDLPESRPMLAWTNLDGTARALASLSGTPARTENDRTVLRWKPCEHARLAWDIRSSTRGAPGGRSTVAAALWAAFEAALRYSSRSKESAGTVSGWPVMSPPRIRRTEIAGSRFAASRRPVAQYEDAAGDCGPTAFTRLPAAPAFTGCPAGIGRQRAVAVRRRHWYAAAAAKAIPGAFEVRSDLRLPLTASVPASAALRARPGHRPPRWIALTAGPVGGRLPRSAFKPTAEVGMPAVFETGFRPFHAASSFRIEMRLADVGGPGPVSPAWSAKASVPRPIFRAPQMAPGHPIRVAAFMAFRFAPYHAAFASGMAGHWTPAPVPRRWQFPDWVAGCLVPLWQPPELQPAYGPQFAGLAPSFRWTASAPENLPQGRIPLLKKLRPVDRRLRFPDNVTNRPSL